MKLLCLAVLGLLFSIAAVEGQGKGKKKCFQRWVARTGFIKSPGYPYWTYKVNQECGYLIEAPSDYHIELTFHKFHLEPKDNDKLTDYLEVFDGRKRRRKQEVYYFGRMKTPFKFVSQTTKIIMRFVSNGQFTFTGFFATYRMLPNPTCNPSRLEVVHGTKDCPVFADTGKTMECDVTCDVNYQLHGNKSLKCADFENPPTCSPIPDKMEGCAENMTSCPYKMEEVVKYLLKEEDQVEEEVNITGTELEVMMDELDANITNVMSHGRGSGTTYLSQCNPPICNSGRAFKRRFLIRCRYFYHRFTKMTLRQKRNRMLHCFRCQSINCKYPVISQIF